MNDAILNNYQRWTERAIADVDVINELKNIAENEGKIEDAFYKDLALGTGGLRGVIGAGTNRLNVYTVAKASQGLADYVIKNFAPEKRKIAVSFDSRIKSDVFAKVASGVFAANGTSFSRRTVIWVQKPARCSSTALSTILQCVIWDVQLVLW